MTTTRIINVDADHVSPDYTFRNTPTKVHKQSDGYFATHPKLGCGKTFDTEWGAIRHLFMDHACTNVRPSK